MIMDSPCSLRPAGQSEQDEAANLQLSGFVAEFECDLSESLRAESSVRLRFAIGIRNQDERVKRVRRVLHESSWTRTFETNQGDLGPSERMLSPADRARIRARLILRLGLSLSLRVSPGPNEMRSEAE